MKRSEGLNPIQKLIGQFIITGIFTYYLDDLRGCGNRNADPVHRRI